MKILNKVGLRFMKILNKVNYCTKWGLQINMKKTKSVVFNNTGKLHDKIFNVNNVPIERAKGYKYLGVYLSSSGSSAEAKEDLYKRGLKALLKFKKSFNNGFGLFHIYLETPFCAVIIQFINTHLQTVSCF
jgi:hypothetical protein